MKIKAVCEATGLTDRTIRFYIEEGLVSPAFTENYLGRKTFDFSQEDVRTLQDIAVLRKFGFTVAEIKEMQVHPEEIATVVGKLQKRKQVVVGDEQALLQVLANVDIARPYTVSALAQLLSQPVAEKPMLRENERPHCTVSVRSIIKWVFIISLAVLPIVWWVIYPKLVFLYPTYKGYWFPSLFLIPHFLVLLKLLFESTVWKWLQKKIRRKPHDWQWRYSPRSCLTAFLLLLCIVCNFPVFVITALSVNESETTDIRNYCVFDSDCPVNREGFVQNLFPARCGEKDAIYYYSYDLFVLDVFTGAFTYDVYAEWVLEDIALVQEIARVRALFSAYQQYPEEMQYTEFETERFICLFRYNSEEPFEEYSLDDWSAAVQYEIFAYDEETGTVRYIAYQSSECSQPYYLSLDW